MFNELSADTKNNHLQKIFSKINELMNELESQLIKQTITEKYQY